MSEHYAAILGDQQQTRSTCVQCSHTRAKRNKKCVVIYQKDGNVRWECKHCQDRGQHVSDFAKAFTSPLMLAAITVALMVLVPGRMIWSAM